MLEGTALRVILFLVLQVPERAGVRDSPRAHPQWAALAWRAQPGSGPLHSRQGSDVSVHNLGPVAEAHAQTPLALPQGQALGSHAVSLDAPTPRSGGASLQTPKHAARETAGSGLDASPQRTLRDGIHGGDLAPGTPAPAAPAARSGVRGGLRMLWGISHAPDAEGEYDSPWHADDQSWYRSQQVNQGAPALPWVQHGVRGRLCMHAVWHQPGASPVTIMCMHNC